MDYSKYGTNNEEMSEESSWQMSGRTEEDHDTIQTFVSFVEAVAHQPQ